MASRLIAIAVPSRRKLSVDRIVLAVALAFAVLSVLVTWQTFAPGSSTGVGISRLESARPVAGAAQPAQ